MLSIIFTFIAAIVIIYLSYLASKYIGKGMGKLQNSRYMRLIDQIAVGQERHIAVLQVGEQISSCGNYRRSDQYLVRDSGRGSVTAFSGIGRGRKKGSGISKIAG